MSMAEKIIYVIIWTMSVGVLTGIVYAAVNWKPNWNGDRPNIVNLFFKGTGIGICVWLVLIVMFVVVNAFITHRPDLHIAAGIKSTTAQYKADIDSVQTQQHQELIWK